jgi:DNA-binding MarR family transcriptional regulator
LTRLPRLCSHVERPMRPQRERELEILSAIEEGTPVTQRALAARLDVALGLTNLYVKRLARKGYIKIVEFPRKPAARKRLRYLLTSKGLAEKSRLTYEHMAYSLRLFRRTRQTLRESLLLLPRNGWTRIALYGEGEAAELAYLTLKEVGIEPVGIFAAEGGAMFLGFPVQAATRLVDAEVDAVVLATFDPADRALPELTRLGIPPEKVLTLRRLPPTENGTGTRKTEKEGRRR